MTAGILVRELITTDEERNVLRISFGSSLSIVETLLAGNYLPGIARVVGIALQLVVVAGTEETVATLDAVSDAGAVGNYGLEGPGCYTITSVQILIATIDTLVVAKLRVDLPSIGQLNQLNVESICSQFTMGVPVGHEAVVLLKPET